MWPSRDPLVATHWSGTPVLEPFVPLHMTKGGVGVRKEFSSGDARGAAASSPVSCGVPTGNIGGVSGQKARTQTTQTGTSRRERPMMHDSTAKVLRPRKREWD